MSDLISRQDAIDAVRSYYDECDEREESIEERIEQLPSADIDLSDFSDKLWQAAYERGKAEAVRHGHWINHPDDLFPEDSSIECSICHEWERILANDNFCPNCGARMDGKHDG